MDEKADTEHLLPTLIRRNSSCSWQKEREIFCCCIHAPKQKYKQIADEIFVIKIRSQHPNLILCLANWIKLLYKV